MDSKYIESPILVIGSGKLASSVTVCLLLAGHRVTLVTDNKDGAIDSINSHFFDLSRFNAKELKLNLLEIEDLSESNAGGRMAGVGETGEGKAGEHDAAGYKYKMGIAITSESLSEKKAAIRQLERNVFQGSAIAVNTESIPLSLLQETCEYPERLIGLNWVEPAHTTFFLELIVNAKTNRGLADGLYELAKTHWNKDPYLISNDVSVRAKMLSGMIREAFYLVQNGYATIEDIDRACRNDAGYYLPFAGNFRYMDLMGTYAYGLVMKDLNRELSKDTDVPRFLEEIIEQGGLGMENGKGFYTYKEGDVQRWNEIFRIFSYQIQDIIEKNPFNQVQEIPVEVKEAPVEAKEAPVKAQEASVDHKS